MRTKGDRLGGDSLSERWKEGLKFGRAKEMNHKHRYKFWRTVNLVRVKNDMYRRQNMRIYLTNLHRRDIHFLELGTLIDP